MFSSLLPKSSSGEYVCRTNLNLYDSSLCQALATQAARGRHLRIRSPHPEGGGIPVQLCEDGYKTWLPLTQLHQLEPASEAYRPLACTRAQIEEKLGEVIKFTYRAMEQPNYYLWGGTVAPNYDCSGLIQAAFASVGVWLPRDSYQQQEFCSSITIEQLQPGDLIFFGETRVDHVALHLGDRNYIHSSGQELGNDGIAIDRLSLSGGRVSQNYYPRFWGCGRVMSSLDPEI